MNVIGYVRVSTEDQAREGVSLDAQRERIEAYCFAKGWRLQSAETDNCHHPDCNRFVIDGRLHISNE